LDKKEETFDLTLTEKGREKLMKGEFKPHSYSFYDNGVIYDNKYGAITESQNSSSPRIKQTLISEGQVTWDDSIIEPDGQKSPYKYPTYYELGSYDYTQVNKPAWKVSVVEGEITGNIKYFPLELELANVVSSLDEYQHDRIPQLNVFCEYSLYQTEEDNIKKIYVDRSSDDMEFEIYEENSFDDKENFILEVYQFSNSYVDLKKLEYVDELSPIALDNVEYFFNIAVDGEDVIEINYSKNLEEIEKPISDLKDECWDDL